jgi:hypothetical protein
MLLKWVNNLTVLSNVSEAYAPKGKVLISVFSMEFQLLMTLLYLKI